MAQTMSEEGTAGRRWRGLAALALALAALAPAAAREIAVAPAPAWVTPVALPDQLPAAATARGGVQVLLVDEQDRVEDGSREVYRRLAMRATNPQGVDALAHIEVTFDPSYQTLTFHAVTLHRGGQASSRLQISRVRLLQQEPDLDSRLYDGRKTATLELEDVRVGDIVDYDYTIRGINPAFRGRQSGGLPLDWRVPVQRRFERLLVRDDRPVQVAAHGASVAPQVSRHDGWQDEVWQAQAVPAVTVDDDAPDDYDPYASVQWTQFPDWASVAAWAVPLYRVAPDQGPTLQSQVAAIARAHPRPEDRLVATLQFVQREVRYVGIEMGVGSFVPRPPRTVLARRFGDCKDKALLMATMLRAMGIDAWPALVNTRLKGGLAERLPSPGMFDHVVVRARVAGHDYWLDPTRSVQEGTLDTITQATYGLALVVDPSTTALTPMVDEGRQLRRKAIHVVIDASAGRGHPVTMDVVTVYDGASAERVRSYLASQTRDATQQDYLNYYDGYEPGIKAIAPLEVSDDAAANRVTVREHYRLPDPWKHSDEKHRWSAWLQSPEIRSDLPIPDRTVRTSPLSLPFPLDVTRTLEVHMYADWPLTVAPDAVDDPAFHFDYGVHAAGRVVTSTEHLHFLANQVAPGRVAAYVANVKKARGLMGLTLYEHDRTPRRPAPPSPVVVLALLGALAAATWLVWRLYQYDPPPRPGPHDPALQGLGGWLLLVGLGLLASPVILAVRLGHVLRLLEPVAWHRLTSAAVNARMPGLGGLVLFEACGAILLLAAALVLTVLFFRKRTSTPRVYVGLSVALLGFALVDHFGMVMINHLAGKAAGSGGQFGGQFGVQIVGLLLWWSYFARSRRVRATFVRRWRPQPATGADGAGDIAVRPVVAAEG